MAKTIDDTEKIHIRNATIKFKRIILPHNQAANSTRKAGSSLANCDFVSGKGKSYKSLFKQTIVQLHTFPMLKISVHLLWCYKQIQHLPCGKLKVHLVEF